MDETSGSDISWSSASGGTVTHAVIYDAADNHWLVFNDDREITGCHCGFVADESDCGWGDSVVAHFRSLPPQFIQHVDLA